jgi:phage shock protein PspC (stress-responsive transcriptional regulator)
MKKTISVNIKGMNFLIEEDAFELLQNYINKLTAVLQNEKGGKEIIEDVELRIAELCGLQLNERKQVIEKEDIETILSTLGDPDLYIDESEQETSSQSNNSNASNTSNQATDKRLFRDVDNATIAGICAGIANYLHFDVVIIRIIFVLFFLFGGFGIPLYIILWIVIPKANSTIDRLRMRGKAITVDTVREEVESAAERINKESKNFANRMRNDGTYNERISRIGRIITSVVGSGIIAFGLFLLVMFLIFGVGGFQFIPVQSDYGFLSFSELGELVMETPSDYQWAWIGGVVMISSIILFILLVGTKMVFRIRNTWSKISLGFLFFSGLFGFIVCLFIGLKTGKEMAIEGEIEQEIGSVYTEQLIIETNSPKISTASTYEVKSKGRWGMMSIENDRIVESGIHIEYRQSKDSLYHVYQNLSAHCQSHRKAVNKAQNIKHNAGITGSRLTLDSHYSFPKSDKLRDQDVYIIVEFPAGKSVKWNNKVIYPGSEMDDNGNYEIDDNGYINSKGEYEHWD